MIVAEVLVNDYLKNPSLEGSANIFQNQTASSQQKNPQQNSPLTNAASTVEASGSASTASLVGSVTTALIQKAGLQSYAFKPVAFDGKLFDKIPFTDLSFIKTFESHLAKNQVANVATFYEFNPGSTQSAKEIYDLIKQKCAGEIGVILNETNSFGDGSFYANYFEFPEKVFVVFRKGTHVFAFTYGKELHDGVTKLIGLL